tara:strand:- start:441 stop:1655 length:1215 start_codon:yes stop_codon:yes gene_type:complete
LIPLIIGIIYLIENQKLGNTYFIIALFTCVDIGGPGADFGLTFKETPGLIRYLIYFIILSVILIRYKIDIQKIWIPFLLLIMPTIVTLSNFFDINFTINSAILRGDIFVFIMTFLVLTNSNKRIFHFDNRILFVFIIFYGFFEIINYLLYYDYTMGYLNYQSIKSLIVFPLIYSLIFAKSNPIKLILFLCTAIVLVGYTTRMIIVSLILTLLIYYFARINLKSLIAGLAICIIMGISILSRQDQGIEETIKVLAMVQNLISGDNFFESLKLIDPWRFGELQLLFDRDLFSILFGEGFGSGIFDSKGYLIFADFGQTAYSEKELTSGMFYNMHDLWTDYGLRFGLLFIIIFLYDVIKNIIFSKNHFKTFYAMLILVLALCAFFSSAGIILITLLYLNYIQIGNYD